MRSALAPLFVVPCCVACGSSSAPRSGVAAQEAGVDATVDAADDACFPFCGSGSSGGNSESGDDGGSGDASCAILRDEVEALQTPARACNPQDESQCSGTAPGICCPITVSAGNDTAASAFEQALDVYKSQCDAGCLITVCPAAPSQNCQAGQTQGICQ